MPAPDRARAAREPTRLGAIYFGSTSPAMDEADDRLAEQGVHLDLMRVRAFPFSEEVATSSKRMTRFSWSSRTAMRQLRTLIDERVRDRPGQAAAGAALRWLAHHRALHRARSTERARSSTVVPIRRRPRHDLSRQAEAASPGPAANTLGFTRRDYEGTISTLCAGCGHDSISAAIVQACFELDLPPHRIAKLSGIGCSSKTPTYFLGAFARLQQRAWPHAVAC